MHHHSSIPIPTAESHVLEFEELMPDDVCVVSIRGEVDLGSAARLKAELGALLAEGAPRDVVLELSRLAHLDSTGLAVLIGFRRRLAAERRLVVANPSPMVTRILTLTGLLSTFDTFDTVSDAVGYLREARLAPRELPLSPDAALVLGLAQTALPFAESYADEARCWQRILLPHDGVHGEGEPGDDRDQAPVPGNGYRERLDRVVAHAVRLAGERGAQAIRTGDLLRGVVTVYGHLFDEAAQA